MREKIIKNKKKNFFYDFKQYENALSAFYYRTFSVTSNRQFTIPSTFFYVPSCLLAFPVFSSRFFFTPLTFAPKIRSNFLFPLPLTTSWPQAKRKILLAMYIHIDTILFPCSNSTIRLNRHFSFVISRAKIPLGYSRPIRTLIITFLIDPRK